MKICFLTSEYPHDYCNRFGGIASSIKNLAEGLAANNVEVVVVVYNQELEKDFKENNIQFYFLKRSKVLIFKGVINRMKVQFFLNKLYKQKKIDIIEAPDWAGFTGLINIKCPLIIKLHGSETYFAHLENRKVKWFTKFQEKRALEKATAIVSVSKFTATITKELFQLKKEITIIPNGVDVTSFTPKNETQLRNKIVLYLGTLIRKKGVLELATIFNFVARESPSVEFVFIGSDSIDYKTKTSTKTLIEEKLNETTRNKTKFLGKIPYNAVQQHIENASICVFPSFAEALPVSWIEAMLMQKPIVASDIGWATEMIENNEEGFLVNPKNHAIFAEKIGELLKDETLATSMGKKAREKAINKFSNAVVLKQNKRFYENIK